MASPVFHGLAGAGLAYAMAGDGSLPLFSWARKNPWLLAAAAVLACLPDADYLPGLWRGALNAVHQQATHSLAWVGTMAAGLWLAGRAWRPTRSGWRAAGFIFILAASHLAIDLVTADGSAPYGIPLWAPLSDVRVQAPVALLPAWDKATLAELWSGNNARALAVELGAGLAFAAGCIRAKRGWTRRPAAL